MGGWPDTLVVQPVPPVCCLQEWSFPRKQPRLRGSISCHPVIYQGALTVVPISFLAAAPMGSNLKTDFGTGRG